MVQHSLVMGGWDKKRSMVIFPSPWLAHQEARKGVTSPHLPSESMGAAQRQTWLWTCWAHCPPVALSGNSLCPYPFHTRGVILSESFSSHNPHCCFLLQYVNTYREVTIQKSSHSLRKNKCSIEGYSMVAVRRVVGGETRRSKRKPRRRIKG